MSVVHQQASHGLWVVFLASWTMAMPWTAKATSRATVRLRILYLLGFALSFGLLFAAPAGRAHDMWRGGSNTLLDHAPLPGAWVAPLWHDPAAVGWALVGAEAAAFLFAWWARLHLGRLWSGMLTLREGHHVVETGPYRLVRHPIYTGFIAASWSLALIAATATALAGALALTIIMATKARGEERLLRRELGAMTYDAYARRTPMIVPFAPR